MSKQRLSSSLVAASFLIIVGTLLPVGVVNGQTMQALRIDVPVTLEKGDVVMDIGHVVFTGDTPFVIGDLNQLVNDYANWSTKGNIVAVFHGDAAYVVLNDDTYDAVRHIATGNPYKKIITEWMGRGVRIELCGATAKANHWVNADLLSGTKVDTDAMARITQLEQQGYTLIYQ